MPWQIPFVKWKVYVLMRPSSLCFPISSNIQIRRIHFGVSPSTSWPPNWYARLPLANFNKLPYFWIDDFKKCIRVSGNTRFRFSPSIDHIFISTKRSSSPYYPSSPVLCNSPHFLQPSRASLTTPFPFPCYAPLLPPPRQHQDTTQLLVLFMGGLKLPSLGMVSLRRRRAGLSRLGRCACCSSSRNTSNTLAFCLADAST